MAADAAGFEELHHLAGASEDLRGGIAGLCARDQHKQRARKDGWKKPWTHNGHGAIVRAGGSVRQAFNPVNSYAAAIWTTPSSRYCWMISRGGPSALTVPCWSQMTRVQNSCSHSRL